jgi:D-alanine-D-alanine ligase
MMKPKVILLYNHDTTLSPDDLRAAAEDRRKAMCALTNFGYHVLDVQVYHSVTEALQPFHFDPREWLVFNWCEGYVDRPWDYGDVTDELDRLGFVYTGADTWSHCVSLDKARVQAEMIEHGVPIPRGRILRDPSASDWSIFPAIVKPTNQHGSFGIDRNAIVLDEPQLRQRAGYIFETFKAPALVEEFIEGRELQVTVWGNSRVEVLPEVEVVFDQRRDWRERIFTYEIKFAADGLDKNNVGFVCPAMLTVQARRAIEQVCRQAYRALRCRGYARIDLRLKNDRPYVLDVNPNPDINSESLLVIAASVVGLSYDDVIARITEFAVERWRAAQQAAGVKRSRKHGQPEIVSQ